MSRIIVQKTFPVGEITLRYPTLSDAQVMCDYINVLSQEESFITFQGEHLTLEEETEYLAGSLKKIESGEAVLLLAFLGDHLIGISGLTAKLRAEKHVAEFGISIGAKFRGQGVGKFLMESVIVEGTKMMKDLKIVILGVFEQNDIARSMYANLGFQEYGRLPKGLKRKGEYQDHIYMYREVKE